MTVVSETLGPEVKESFLPPGTLGGAADSVAMNLDHLTPGPDLKPRSSGLGPDQGWCKRCGEATDQWYQRTLDQARIRLCKRCKRESEAEIAIA